MWRLELTDEEFKDLFHIVNTYLPPEGIDEYADEIKRLNSIRGKMNKEYYKQINKLMKEEV